MQDYYILDPHTTCAYLFNEAGLHVPISHVKQYWEFAKQNQEPWAANVDHDFMPLGVYGDGAKAVTNVGIENVIGIFLNVILWRARSVRHSRFLIFTIPEEKLWGFQTLNKVWARVVWSLNALWYGFHPSSGPLGEKLPARLEKLAGCPIVGNGMRFQCTEIRGDWSWAKKIWRFESCSWTAINCCHLCPAQSKSENWEQLYWNFDTNTFDENEFSLTSFINERMPSHGICLFS